MIGSLYITDFERLIAVMRKFVSFVQSKDQREDGLISFTDPDSWLYKEEGYKAQIARDARRFLGFDEWDESWLGTEKISARAIEMMELSGNLVNYNQRLGFKHSLERGHKWYNPEAERMLYHLFSSTYSEEDAFNEAKAVYGGNYDRIAYLFFVKNDEAFLPISSGHIDDSFAMLNIDYKTARSCGWDNYTGYIRIVEAIKEQMDEIMPLQRKARLIDAHSFLWVIQQNRFMEWEPERNEKVQIEEETEQILTSYAEGSGKRSKVYVNPYQRSGNVSKIVKARANGICQLCGNAAPFTDKEGEPFLEVHHVEWLSRGGKDSTDNAVALCPNCHRKIHHLEDPADIAKLKKQCAGEQV